MAAEDGRPARAARRTSWSCSTPTSSSPARSPRCSTRPRGGRLVAFREPDRSTFRRMGRAARASAWLARRPYLSSASIFAAGELAGEVLELMQERQQPRRLRAHLLAPQPARLPVHLRRPGRLQRDHSDQARPRAGAPLDQRLAPTPPFTGLRLIEPALSSLRVRRRRRALPGAPSHGETLARAHPPRCLLAAAAAGCSIGEDLAIRIPEQQVPLRLRSGARAYAGAKARQRARALSLARIRARCAAPHLGEASCRESRLLLRRRRALLPRRRRPDQLAAAGRPRPSRSTCSTAGSPKASASCSAGEVELVDAPAGAPPTLLKTIAPLRHPARDDGPDRHRHDRHALAGRADRRAPQGKVVAFENDTDRHVAAVGRGARPRPASAPALRQLRPRRSRRRGRAPRSCACSTTARAGSTSSAPTGVSGGSPTTRCSTPTRTCSTRSSPARVEPRAPRRARRSASRRCPRSPARGRRPRAALRCAYADGIEPLRRPPLARQALARAHPPRRLLAAAAAPARSATRSRSGCRRAQIPLRFRGGLRACAERRRINARERLRYHVREPLGCPGQGRPMNAAFYCVADERYFLGAVGLINSLRLVGHDEPIHLLDCGLRARPARAARLRGHARRRPHRRARARAEDDRAAAPPGRDMRS